MKVTTESDRNPFVAWRYVRECVVLVGMGTAWFSVPTISTLLTVSSSAPPDPELLVRNLAVAALAGAVASTLLMGLDTSPRARRAALGVFGATLTVYPVLMRASLGIQTSGVVRVVVDVGFVAFACVATAGICRRSTAADIAASAATVVISSYSFVAVLLVSLTYALHTPAIVPESVYREVSVSPQRFVPGPSPPDVYHIVFDGLGRPDRLESRYGVHGSRDLERLESLGVQIASDRGVANYAQTYLSVASMMNMSYLTPLSQTMRERNSRVPLREVIQRSSVIRAFSSAGYRVSFIGSGYSATASLRLASECDCAYPVLSSEFETFIVRRTPLAGILPDSWEHTTHRDRALHNFERLLSLRPSAEPHFLFAHIMVPHPPFVFDELGRSLSPPRGFSIGDGPFFEGSRQEYRDGYARQAKYVLNQIPRIVQHLVEVSRNSGRDAVVIVHGDHGPRALFYSSDPPRTDVTEVFPVFLAIRWATGGRMNHSREIDSLVNVYRAVFSRYFDSDLQPLPDRVYLSSFSRPYDLVDVTANLADGTALSSTPSARVD